MAQKSKAASLTPDLLMSKGVPPRSAPRKQATDLSLAPGPAASQPEPAKSAAPEPTRAAAPEPAKSAAPEPTKAAAPKPTKAAPPPANAKSKAKEIEPVRQSNAERTSGDVPTAAAQTDAPAEPPPSNAGTIAESAEPDGNTGKIAAVDEVATADGHLDDRIRIPVPLDPSEHLELTLAAARSGRSCQEIIVEALFRYLDDIAGSLDRPPGPGPDGPR